MYGYDNTVSLAGSIYEAETKCTSTHNWGQVASDTASYMAFYSRLSPAVSGRSSVLNVNSLLTGLHLLLYLAFRVTSWWCMLTPMQTLLTGAADRARHANRRNGLVSHWSG